MSWRFQRSPDNFDMFLLMLDLVVGVLLWGDISVHDLEWTFNRHKLLVLVKNWNLFFFFIHFFSFLYNYTITQYLLVTLIAAVKIFCEKYIAKYFIKVALYLHGLNSVYCLIPELHTYLKFSHISDPRFCLSVLDIEARQHSCNIVIISIDHKR